MRCKLIKEKYNRLIVKSQPYFKESGKTKKSHIIVQCECGSEPFEVRLTSLVQNHTQSCGCLKRQKASDRTTARNLYNNPSIAKFSADKVSGRYLCTLKAGAKTRGVVFDISQQDIQDTYEDQHGLCALSGIPISFATRQDNIRRYEQTASVDRIDSSKGYIPGNIQIIHKELNRLKRHYDQAKIIEYCHLISSFQSGQNDQAEMLEEVPVHHKNWQGYGNISLTYWNTLVYGASCRGLNFPITIEDGWNLFVKQNGRCAYTGLSISFGYYFGKDSKNQTASLDRIDNNRVYDLDNIKWVHKDVNFMKGGLTDTEFREWCHRISTHCAFLAT